MADEETMMEPEPLKILSRVRVVEVGNDGKSKYVE